MQVNVKGESVKRGAIEALRSIFFKEKVVRDYDAQGEEVEYSTYLFSPKKVFKALFIIWATLGFSLFMLEEGFQTTMFACFPLQEVRRYDLLEKHVLTMEKIRKTGAILNRMFGWANPFFYPAYDAYFNYAAPAYIMSMNAVIEANGGENLAPIVPAGAVAPLAKVNVAMFTPAPVVNGSIPIEEASKWVGWQKTVIVPVTSIDKREKVAIAKTPTNFTIIGFPSNMEIYSRFDDMHAKWVVIHGEIIKYESTYEIILNSWSQVSEMHDLLAQAD